MIDHQAENEDLLYTIETYRKAKEFGEVLDRLIRNPDFVQVIEENYFKEEASRNVMLRADPECIGNPDMMKMVDNAIIGIGSLRMWIQSQMVMAKGAASSLEEAEAELRNFESQQVSAMQ